MPGLAGRATIAPPSTTFSPLSLTPSAWYDASDSSSITIATGVSQWNDKSGNNRHLTQGTGSLQPVVTAAAQNGKDAITFDGTDDKLVASTAADWTFLHNGNATIFAVFRIASGSISGLMGTRREGTSDRGVYFAPRFAGTASYQNYTGSAFVSNGTYTSTALTTNTIGVWNCTWADASASNRMQYRANGSNVTETNSDTGTPSASAPSNVLNVGAMPSTYFLNGRVMELIFYPTSLSGTDVTNVETYLNTKWAIF